MKHAKRSALIGLSGLTLLAMFAATFFFTGHTQAASSTRFLAAGGTGGFTVSSTASSVGIAPFEAAPTTDSSESTPSGHGTQTPPTVAPNPSPNGVTTQNQGFSGFVGLDHFNSRTARQGNQFSGEPPDQGMCVGGSFVVETINSVTAVYNRFTHKMVAGPTALTEFFGLPPDIVRSNPPVLNSESTDPKCYFDPATNHWFMTMLLLDLNNATGGFAGPTHVFIAVSQTSDPTGAWSVFKFSTTDDGSENTPKHPGCPCLGDQPLIGADANGFFVSTNEFSTPGFGNAFNGAQVYAINKGQLINAAKHAGSLPALLQFDVGETVPTPDQGALWGSLQPATSPELDSHEPNYGTEYFLSSLDFFGTLDNRLAVWALTNTSDLGGSHADRVTLSHTVIGSETYGQPPNAVQKNGSTPLRDLIAAVGDPAQPLNLLAGNDDRMNQVVYANGLLWSAVNTIVQVPGGPARVGAAYFLVRPDFDHGHLTAKVAQQGYVSVAGDSVLYPSIGVTNDGQAVIAFSLTGPDRFPSAAYALFDGDGHAGKVHIAAAGVGPDDGFSGYTSPSLGLASPTPGIGRWGDYSAAVAGPNGTIWFANEYIGQTCTDAQFNADTTCGGTRTILANWGTFISSVRVED